MDVQAKVNEAGTGGAPPICVSVAEAAQLLGVGRTTLLGIIGAGDLPTRKVGRRRLVLVRELEAFAAGLPVAAGTDR